MWYHGSDKLFEVLRPGSTITQNKDLAIAFSHQPTWLMIEDDGSIQHNGTASGYLYIIDEPISVTEDLMPVPNSTMEPGMEWHTRRELRVKVVKHLGPAREVNRMKRRNDSVIQWAVDKVQREYHEDVSLLLMYGSYENGTANPLSDVDMYFIPKTEGAQELSTTFIIEGVGYDLFPMSWSRVKDIADFNDYLTPCLGNVKILYCNSPEDRERFEKLQARLQANLADKKFMLTKACQRLEEAVRLYGQLVFADDLGQARTLSGYVAMFLAEAVAYTNQTYFARGLKTQLEDLKGMAALPRDFIFLYEGVAKANSTQELRGICQQMITNTKELIEAEQEPTSARESNPDYSALANWYQELVSTWNKIKVACATGNTVLAYLSGTCLQRELDRIAAEYGLGSLDLMGAYAADDLNQLQSRAALIQKTVIQVIKAQGITLAEYATVEEFLAGGHD